MSTLSSEEISRIESIDADIASMKEELLHLSSFKKGDYLIAYCVMSDRQDVAKNKQILLVNSYGEPRKFKVIYVSKEGVPFLNRITSKGNLDGTLICALYKYINDSLLYDDYFNSDDCKIRFELDPEYADHILMGTPYDPVHNLRIKISDRSEILKYNKNIKVDTNTIEAVIKFLLEQEVGSKLWISNKTYYSVKSLKKISKFMFYEKYPHQKYFYYRHKVSYIPVIIAEDKYGKTVEILPDKFFTKALYRQQPKSYKKHIF